MQRRELLKTGAAFLAGAAASTPQQPPPPQAKITSSVMLWTLKGSFEEKLETAARSGVQSVEMVAEYANWTDADIARIKKLARSFRLGMDALIATPDWNKRPVSMVDPAQRDNFLADVRNAITYAQKLEVPQILLMSGNAIPGRTHDEQYASLLEGSKRAGDLVAAANRSEEHTSELQSRSDLVCRLLLEKKKKINEHKIRSQEQSIHIEYRRKLLSRRILNRHYSIERHCSATHPHLSIDATTRPCDPHLH